MQEDFQFLDLRGERLFAAFHVPAQPTSRAIVMCHPLGEEKLWAERTFVAFAREASAAGFTVLRFDFRGEGNSDREFHQSDFHSRIEDAEYAIAALRGRVPHISEVALLGLRFGACVAAATAARRTDVSQLLLWDPVLDGAAYMQSFLRLNLMSQMALHRRVVESRELLVARLNKGDTVNVEGYALALPLYTQVSAYKLASVLPSFHGKALLVQVDQRPTPLKTELSTLAAANGCRVETVIEEPFWKEIKTFYQRAPELTRVTFDALRQSS